MGCCLVIILIESLLLIIYCSMKEAQKEIVLSSQQFRSTVYDRSEPSSPQPLRSTYRKVNSTDKPTVSHTIRQTVQLKRKKFHKLAYESKPISIGSIRFPIVDYDDDNFFAMEPQKSSCLHAEQSPKIVNKMMPTNGSSWVNKNKCIQSKFGLGRRDSSVQEPSKVRSSSYYDINQEVSDIKDYMHSVKHYFMQHKKRMDKERRIKVKLMNQVRISLEEKGNLSIIKLKPSSQKQNNKHTLQSQKQSLHLTEYHSTHHLQNSSPAKSECHRMETKTADKNKSQRVFRRKQSTRKKDYHFIFGEFKTFMTEESLLKLKTLYYRDFLWKISFNRNLIFQSAVETHRYYVGKGNNSRLIRKIMNKRSWWVEEAKQENAHFIWTQLKIYEVYKNQRSQKASKASSKLAFCEGVTIGESQILLSQPVLEPEKSRNTFSAGHVVDKNRYVLNDCQYGKWRSYISGKGEVEKKPMEDMKQRHIQKMQIKKVSHKITNHLQCSRVIGNKKALYRTMQTFFNYKGIEDWYIPMTFHITGGLENEEYLTFLREFYKKSKEGLAWWIVKPGELSNRGKDIQFCSNLQQIKDQIKQKKVNPNGSPRTYIVQSYLHTPFLYQGRKFDLRHYLMITSTEGKIRGYFYQEGYVRTTSYAYSLQSAQPGVHLTNDAVQKCLPNYGKYEKGNKLSYEQFNEYMLKLNPQKGFYNTIFPQLKKIGSDIIEAAFPFIDPERRANNFELFGIDVMIDSDYKCWLIQVNTNPCIEVNCPVLAAIIPAMLDNALTIGLDSLVTPPIGKPKVCCKNYLVQNKFQLVFDEQTQGRSSMPPNIDIGSYGDDDDNYQSCQQDCLQ